MRLPSLAWAMVLLYAGLIWFLSAQSHAPAALSGLRVNDKLMHLAEYALLAFLLRHAFMVSLRARNLSQTAVETSLDDAAAKAADRALQWRILLWTLVCTALWGLIDEVHQSFVPGRDSDPLDWLADLCGAGVGITVHHLWQCWRPSSQRR
ncbi:MAG: VanZ family protein [Polyangiales bacterium]